MTNEKKLNIQLCTATIITISGVVLLFAGFFVAPTGLIDNSVLIAFGEICTYAGGLFGIDYNYKYKSFLKERENDN